jgi:N-acyl-D-amino-acid deacylase
MLWKKKVITLEEAIKKSTSMPAEMIGLKDRGTIKEGNIADIVFLKLKLLNYRT